MYVYNNSVKRCIIHVSVTLVYFKYACISFNSMAEILQFNGLLEHNYGHASLVRYRKIKLLNIFLRNLLYMEEKDSYKK